MGVTSQKVTGTTMIGLAVLLLSWSCAAGTEQAQVEQKSSEQLLLAIVDLHSRLVTNDVFLSQAKMLGAYLESAQPMEESKKAAIYRSVLGMLEKIKESNARAAVAPAQEKVKAEQKSPATQRPDGPVKYTRGIALLEIFKGNSLSQLPDVPVIRTYWKQGLAYRGFPLPGRVDEVGNQYVARFTFFYEAKQSGKYSFTGVSHGIDGFILRVGGVDVLKSSSGIGVFGGSGVTQGICDLEKGFHRVEFWAIDNAYYEGFEIKVLPAGEFDTVPFTQDMMLLPADQVKAPQAGQQKGASGQAIPYVDY